MSGEGLELRIDGAAISAPEAASDLCNPATMVRYITNNAMDAVEAGGAISVDCFKNSDHVCIEITDDGPGVPREIVATLFEPFTSIGKERSTGLGLQLFNDC